MKKICSAILVLAMVFGVGVMGTTAVSATEAIEIMPFLSYTSITSTGVGISGGQVVCVGHISGYKGTTTKVEMTVYLERKLASSSTWSTYASSSKQTFNDYTGTYQMKVTAVKGYQYRTRAVYVAYAGTKSETITGYSSVTSY